MLTKDSFPLTHLFLCYQTLENTENYLYIRFFIETNRERSKTMFLKIIIEYIYVCVEQIRLYV